MAFELQQLLETIVLGQLHPKSLITVVVQPISLDGSAFACMVNATIAALLDAGIPLRTTVVALSVAQGEHLLLDPVAEEEQASSWFIFDAQATSNDPISYKLNGTFELGQFPLLCQTTKAASAQVYNVLCGAVKQRLELI